MNKLFHNKYHCVTLKLNLQICREKKWKETSMIPEFTINFYVIIDIL